MTKEHCMLKAKILQDQGKTQLQIATELGVTDRTIRNYLKRFGEPRGRRVRQSKLDAFKAFIDMVLEDNPFLNREILLERLRKRGYEGPIFDRQSPVLIRAASATSGEGYAAERGDFITLSGQRLKFDKAREDLGVWYKNGAEYRAAKYASVTPGTVIAQVPPELEPGQYLMVIRTSPNGKDVKSATLPDLVSIV